MEYIDVKKAFLLTVVAILVFIITVVGVSFAWSAFYEDSKPVIRDTEAYINFDNIDNSIKLSGANPKSDKDAIRDNDNRWNFTVSCVTNSKNFILYDLGLTGISSGEKLTSDYIKIALLDESGKVIVGQKDKTGSLVSGELVSNLGPLSGKNNIITVYGLTGGKLKSSSDIHKYTLIAYVSDSYNNVKNGNKDVYSFSISVKTA